MQSFYLNNIVELLWYGKILFFLLLYLTWGVVQCDNAFAKSEIDHLFTLLEAKQKLGMFETQKSGNNNTSSGEIGLDIRTHASPKVG